jgi:tRNA A-37 threonylcarbamoyl transferase component Bud32
MENLALLIAQLPPAWERCLDVLVAAYQAEQERLRPDCETLLLTVERARAQRLAHFLSKTVRDCSQFAVRSTISRFSAVVRTEKEVLSALMEDPDEFIARGQLLKNGNTCTVARVDIGGRALVVKRYNLKSVSHALSRFWRPSRAWHSWVAGHRLAFYGICTPAPLALLEERAGPLRGRAFLVTEYCAGASLLQHLSADREPGEAEADAIKDLFAKLFRLKISHGDMKASNLLWHDRQLALIDLDSMVQPSNHNTFVRDWRRDRERFLKNWPRHSPLHLWLTANLPRI